LKLCRREFGRQPKKNKMPSNPSCSHRPEDDACSRDTSRDPYALWHDRPLESLPYHELRDGIATYLKTFYKAVWDVLTPNRHPFYLSREEGLSAWCRYEASIRLERNYRDTYSIIEFHELIFREDLRRSGRKTLSDPFWTPLMTLKQREEDIEFFGQLPFLIDQPEQPMHQGMRRLALGWDRELIPLSFWTYLAISRRIKWEEGREVATENTLRQWVFHLRLKQQKPAIITAYNEVEGPFIDEAALEFHGIPELP
jgi:hypothetical protein